MTERLDVVIVAYRSERDLPSVLSGIETLSSLPRRVHLFDNDGNKKTLSAAWNDLAAAGDGELLCFLNTDIRLSPGWDGRLAEALGRCPDAGAVLPNPVGHDWPALLAPPRPAHPDHRTAPPPTPEAMAEIAGKWAPDAGLYSFAGTCDAAFYAVMVRRETFRALRGFDERFRFYGQDHDFQRRLRSRTGKGAVRVSCCPVWHRCAGSVHEAAVRGEVDFGAEMRHNGAMSDAVRTGRLREWDLMTDAERGAVRADPRYNRMPRA